MSKKIHRMQFVCEASQLEALNALDAAALMPVGSKQEMIRAANIALNRRDKLNARLVRLAGKQHEMEARRLRANKLYE